jgi:phosphoribosylanthranilate isomerase
LLIKICCISTIEEAELALSHRVDALGLVSSMPSGPGVISEDRIAEIASSVPADAKTVLLTSLTDPQAIADQFKRCRVNSLQLCAWLPRSDREQLRALLPGAFIMQVVHVAGDKSLDESIDAQNWVDALLLDSGNPRGETVELGGTGRVHDWTVSRQICEATDVTVFLAGGLNPDNVRLAIAQVRPSGIDICSGVRTNGSLDPLKLSQFVSVVRSSTPTAQ